MTKTTLIGRRIDIKTQFGTVWTIEKHIKSDSNLPPYQKRHSLLLKMPEGQVMKMHLEDLQAENSVVDMITKIEQLPQDMLPMMKTDYYLHTGRQVSFWDGGSILSVTMWYHDVDGIHPNITFPEGQHVMMKTVYRIDDGTVERDASLPLMITPETSVQEICENPDYWLTYGEYIAKHNTLPDGYRKTQKIRYNRILHYQDPKVESANDNLVDKNSSIVGEK